MSLALKRQETYQKMQMQNASREELLLMTFDWLLASVRRASKAIDLGRRENGRKGLILAQEALLCLLGTLDMGKGKLAADLRRLYIYSLRRLAEAAINLDGAIVTEILQLLAPLGEAFHQAAAVEKAKP